MSRTKGPYTEKQVARSLGTLSGWVPNKRHTELKKTFTLPTAVTALAFAAKITVHAEVIGHHPTIELEGEVVRVKLTTKDVKGLSKKDFDLAKRIDKLTAH